MESVGLKEEDALDRTNWKNDIQYHSVDPRWLEQLNKLTQPISFLVYESKVKIRIQDCVNHELWPYEGELSSGRLAKTWQYDVDNFWKGTISQRRVEISLEWTRHSEAFLTTTA